MARSAVPRLWRVVHPFKRRTGLNGSTAVDFDLQGARFKLFCVTNNLEGLPRSLQANAGTFPWQKSRSPPSRSYLSVSFSTGYSFLSYEWRTFKGLLIRRMFQLRTAFFIQQWWLGTLLANTKPCKQYFSLKIVLYTNALCESSVKWRHTH